MNVRRTPRRWRFNRRKLFPAWMDIPLAVAAAVAFHLLFFGVFQSREPENSSGNARTNVTLLNISSLSAEKQNAAVKWLVHHDPKLALRGDSAVGFSSFLPASKQKDINIKESKVNTALPQVKIKEYSAMKHTPSDSRNMPLPSFSVEQKELPGNSIVVDNSGKRLKLDIPGRNFQPGVTVIALKGSGYYRYAEILEPCSQLQDNAAANAIVDSGLESGRIYTIIWKGGRK